MPIVSSTLTFNMIPSPLTITPVALITGGARRLGSAMVRALHAADMNVVIHYLHSETEALALKTELENFRTDSVLLVKGDLCDAETPKKIIREIAAHFGRLDLLVNNASSFYPTLLSDTSNEQFNELIGTNLKAPYFLAQAAANDLIKTEGAIINITDIYADRPLKSYSIYSSAKAALVSLTQSLARELAPSVRVNAISPGILLWPEGKNISKEQKLMIEHTPLKRIGTPDDIQSALLFLAQDAHFITGQVLCVDGGRSILA
jgi:pteridine reductase